MVTGSAISTRQVAGALVSIVTQRESDGKWAVVGTTSAGDPVGNGVLR